MTTVGLAAPIHAHAAQRIIEGLPYADAMPTGHSDLVARIFFSANQIGEFEPCSCPETPLGGLAQQAGVIEQARLGELPVFWFDAGDRLFRHDFAMNSIEEAQRRRTAILMVDSGGSAGLDAHGIGRLDLGAGLPYLKKLAQRSAAPMLSANLEDDDGELLFESSVVVERGGLRIGVTSVVSADTKGDGYRAREPVAAARAMVRDLKKRGVDLVVLLSNLSADDDRKLAWGARPDVLLGSRTREIHAEGPTVGRTTIGRAGSRGRYLGDVRWYAKGRGPGPHLLVTVTPVRTDGPSHSGVARLVQETLGLLADPVLGVPPFELGDPGRPER
jgi:2',3'-cyclic-nucleotide 2'-phosphodiesterase (5'-nucleotidase family)